MKKNRIAIILLLLVVLSCPVFSNQEGCEHTVEFILGSTDAINQPVPLRYGVLGFLSIWIGSGVGKAVWGEDDDFWDRPEDTFVAGLIGAVIGTGVSLAVPLASKPKPKVIPERISEEYLECYLHGYALRARRRRVRTVLIGGAVGGCFFIFRGAMLRSLFR